MLETVPASLKLKNDVTGEETVITKYHSVVYTYTSSMLGR